MIKLHPTLKRLDAHSDDIIEMSSSVNAPSIAAEGNTPEPTRGYLCRIRRPNSQTLIAIFLYLTQSNRGLLYGPEEGEVPQNRARFALAEAKEFVESMGFIMERVELAALSQEGRQAFLATCPPFMEDLSSLASEGSAAGEAVEEAEAVIDLEEVTPEERATVGEREAAQPAPTPAPAREEEIDLDRELAQVGKVSPSPTPSGSPRPSTGEGEPRVVLGKIKVKAVSAFPKTVPSPADRQPASSLPSGSAVPQTDPELTSRLDLALRLLASF